MIPKGMESFLKQVLPERTWNNRLVREHGKCYMEFGPMDVERLGRLGIQVDALGPRVVACLWDEESPLEVGGYLVIDNLAMGRPSIGGIRMLPDLTPSAVFNLARAMTLKSAAANLPYGGGKAGIVAGQHLTPEEHTEVVRRFAHLLRRYSDIFLPGPDVGTDDADMKTIAIENGLDAVVSKPVDMGGNQVDHLGAGGGGLVIALQTLLEEMPRLKVLPQFASLEIPPADQIKVIFQGFGYMGANAARFLEQHIPGARVAGVSDGEGYLFNPTGLPVETLYQMFTEKRYVTQRFYHEHIKGQRGAETKFSTAPNDLLREDAFALIPAAHIAQYLDTADTDHPEAASHSSMTVDHMGHWTVIVEGANTYSPDPARKAARARMERAVYRQKGVLIATDYLVNAGGVIFAAQDHLIPTPGDLEIPENLLGNREAVDQWLAEHTAGFNELAEKRRLAGETARSEVIRRNIREFIELLAANPDLLPGEAAERLSIHRIAARESDRAAADIMESIITVPVTSTIRDAAKVLVETGAPILAVLSARGELAGVITAWDITRAAATGLALNGSLDRIMNRHVVSAAPTDTVLELVRKLEYHEISAMPVVDGETVLGMVNTDLLSRRSLLRLLQAHSV